MANSEEKIEGHERSIHLPDDWAIKHAIDVGHAVRRCAEWFSCAILIWFSEKLWSVGLHWGLSCCLLWCVQQQCPDCVEFVFCCFFRLSGAMLLMCPCRASG
ncbi:hypothetical protein MRB53_028386 [Persea americana]|uniref:Uncharacterized protein n=1 Tax=Persea americana TaxID=3435 RepID=A0ACC2KFC7_PERAE|nr:hypothetical protein MRB53_028386 [Persea americana]